MTPKKKLQAINLTCTCRMKKVKGTTTMDAKSTCS